LKAAGKELAARNYLGIDPKDFDEYDPQHVAAQNHAMMEIRDRARAMHEQTARVQQFQQARQAQFAQMCQDFQKQEPDFQEINDRFFPQWREKLTKREYDAVDAIIRSGDMGTIRKLVEKVTADYKASKAAPGVKAPPPPPVMTAGGGAGETSAMVDIGSFGSMSPQEQAEFLVKNKWATL
jgi:hypothetical protein